MIPGFVVLVAALGSATWIDVPFARKVEDDPRRAAERLASGSRHLGPAVARLLRELGCEPDHLDPVSTVEQLRKHARPKVGQAFDQVPSFFE